MTTQIFRLVPSSQGPASICDIAPQGYRTRKVREWLLAVLRFALTLEPVDRTTVLAIAEEMDRFGSPAASFSFFIKTSIELCDAIANTNDPQRVTTLRRHLRRIGDHCLRRTFEAAIGL